MTKEFLKSYQAMKREREQLENEIKTLDAKLKAPRVQNLTGMPASHNGTGLDESVARLIELKERYKQLEIRIAIDMLRIEDAIQRLDPTLRTIMRYRYIDGLKWEEVCCKVNYSWQNIHILHKKALQEIKREEK